MNLKLSYVNILVASDILSCFSDTNLSRKTKIARKSSLTAKQADTCADHRM